jgi:hypothetical protein
MYGQVNKYHNNNNNNNNICKPTKQPTKTAASSWATPYPANAPPHLAAARAVTTTGDANM